MLNTALLIAASLALGQSDERNAASEHLKALEPMIGTWRISRAASDVDDTIRWEAETTYSWWQGRNCVMGVTKSRRAPNDGVIEDAKWETVAYDFFTWNRHNKCIEQHLIRGPQGVVRLEVWTPKADDEFAVERKSLSRSSFVVSRDATVRITSEKMTKTVSNQKDPDGNALEDFDIVHTRVK